MRAQRNVAPSYSQTWNAVIVREISFLADRCFYLHGAGAGASGAMVAHMHRVRTGQGQYVDVSCQEAMARALANAPQSYTMEHAIIQRQGAYRQTGASSFMRLTWPCKDGYVNFQFSGGQGSGLGVNNLIRWMAEDPALAAVDFTTLGYGTMTPEMLAWMVPPIARFLLSKTKRELFQGAVARRILDAGARTEQPASRRRQRHPGGIDCGHCRGLLRH